MNRYGIVFLSAQTVSFEEDDVGGYVLLTCVSRDLACWRSCAQPVPVDVDIVAES